MPPNHNKTKVVKFTVKTVFSFFNYTIEGMPIKRAQEIKDLSILFDNKLLMVRLVESTVVKAWRNLALLRWMARLFIHIDTSVLQGKSLVRSHVEYNTIIWNYDRDTPLSWFLLRAFYLVAKKKILFSSIFLSRRLARNWYSFTEVRKVDVWSDPLLTSSSGEYYSGVEC